MPVKLNSTGGGSVTLTTPSTASDFTLTVPAVTGSALVSTSGASTSTTGIDFPSANTVSIKTNGTTAVTVDSSQNVGIGTSSPLAKVQADSSSSTYSANIRARNSNFGNGVIGAASGILTVATDMNNLAFYTASNLGVDGTSAPTNERARIDSSGNLLVGTTSNPYTTNKTAISGGTFYNQYAVVISTSGTTLFNGVAGMVVLRSNTTGGTAIIAFDVSTGISIVGQSGSVFTTSSPTASQIQLSVGTSPFRLIATAGSSKNGDTVNFGTVLCQ